MLITGCHRSGTSLLAAIAAQCVVEERSHDLAPLVDNPTGYFESHQLRDCNDYLLRQLGYSWHHPPLHPLAWPCGERLQMLIEYRHRFRDWGTTKDWLDKDPRLCLTYGAFEHILLQRAPLALSLRKPHEVAFSLYKRDGISIAKGLLIWFLYNRSASFALQAGDPVVLYEEILGWADQTAKAHASLNTVWEWLDQHLANKTKLGQEQEQLRQRVQLLIKPSLHRSNQELETNCFIEANLSKLCDELYANIKYTQANERTSAFRQCFDAVPSWLINNYEAVLLSGSPDLEHLRDHPSDESQAVREELVALKGSTSWKVTQPLRWIGDRLQNRR